MSGTNRNTKTGYFILKPHSKDKYNIRSKIINLYSNPRYIGFWNNLTRQIYDFYFGTGFVHDESNNGVLVPNPTLSSVINVINPPIIYGYDIDNYNVTLSKQCANQLGVSNILLNQGDCNTVIKDHIQDLSFGKIIKLLILDIDCWGAYPSKLRLPFSTIDWIGSTGKGCDILLTYPIPRRIHGLHIKKGFECNSLKESMPFKVPKKKMDQKWWMSSYIQFGLSKYWKYICAYPAKTWNNVILYYLVYCTNNETAFKIGSDIMIKEMYGKASKEIKSKVFKENSKNLGNDISLIL